MDNSRSDLALLVFDFSASGVARNAIRIAARAATLGVKTELWAMRDEGPFRIEVPGDVKVVVIGRGPIRAHGLRRGFANLMAVPQLSELIKKRRPRVLLSAGNHFHFAAGFAYRFAGSPSEVRFIGRASNATPRLGRKQTLFGELANRLDALKYRGMHQIIAVSR